MAMQFISTRGQAPPSSFSDVLLAGLAPDGGLYMPVSWPRLDALPAAPSAHYSAAAAYVMAPYTAGNPGHADLFTLVSEAYAGFDHAETAPLKQIGDDLFLLELFHGPTLAFKDFAMQLLGRLFARLLAKQNRRATVIVATAASGASMTPLVDGLAVRGRLIVVGAADDPIEVSTGSLIFGGRSIEGSLTGTPSENEENLAFSLANDVRPMVEARPLDEAADAYARMMSGAARFRMVLTTN